MSRTSGSEGGPQKPTGRKTGRALRSDPYTEHPTREGKIYCCVVIDAYSRRVVGWAIDSRQRSDLATSALGMAIDSRGADGQIPGAIIHGDHGIQFISWAFTERARKAGLTAPDVTPPSGSRPHTNSNNTTNSRLQTPHLHDRKSGGRSHLAEIQADARIEYSVPKHRSARGALARIPW